MEAKTTRDIAKFVCQTDFRDLSADVVEYSKVLALSHLGMCIAGSVMKSGQQVIEYARAKGAASESGVIGAGFRTTADYAALVNGNSSHATELEDDSFPEGMTSCGHWPTVFAMGEKLGRSGRELIEASVIGYDVAARLGQAFLAAYDKGRAGFSGLATIGNAATAAKLLGLDVEQTASALSIAVSQAAGLRRQSGTGAHLVEAGFAGRNGVCAAELAALGYAGNPTILEGRYGFGDMWADSPDWSLSLGEEFRIMRVCIKKYSCCYGLHRNIDGLLDIISEHGLTWDEVAEIEHGISARASSNFLHRDQPVNEEEARFSFAHCSVACFFEKNVFLESFTSEKVNDPLWREARKKVRVKVLPELALGDYHTWDSPLTVKLKDGRTFTRLCHNARGDPDIRRFGIPEITRKFEDCVEFAGTYSHARASEIAEMVLALEKEDDPSDFYAALTFPDRLESGRTTQALR